MGVLLQNCWLIWSAAPPALEGVMGWGLCCRGWCWGRLARQHLSLVRKAIDFGLLVVPAGPRVVRFVPPLVIKPQLNLACHAWSRTLQAIAPLSAITGASISFADLIEALSAPRH